MTDKEVMQMALDALQESWRTDLGDTAGEAMNLFGLAPIKREGGVTNPDDYIWECNCDKCQAKYQHWKARFEAEQKELKDKNT